MSGTSEPKYPKMRAMLEENEKSLVEALGPPDSSIDEFYKTITFPDGHETKLKVWRSKITPPSERPLILMFHGGGFFSGSIEMITRPGREFAKDFGAVVVSASYRLAPEDKWPAGAMDGIAITKYLSAHAPSELGASPSQGFIVGGLSAGANIAAVSTHQLKNEALPHAITGSFIGIPLLMIEAAVPDKYKHLWTSRQENESKAPFDGPKDDEKMVELISADAASPLFSPTNDLPSLNGLPRTYFQLGNDDPLRDDGVVYVKALEDAGVEVKVDTHQDVGHECFSIWYDEAKESQRVLKTKTMEGVAWLLGRRWSEAD